MMFMILLTPILLAGLIAVAVRWGSGLFTQDLRPPHEPVPGAHEILAQRYARGEISKDQYDQVLADITG